MQDRPIDFNVTEYQKFTNMDSDSILQLTFKKLPLFEFGIVSKNNHNFLKRLYEIRLPFPVTSLCKTVSSSYTSTEITL